MTKGWRKTKDTLSNGGKGKCWLLAGLGHRAIGEGVSAPLAQQALSTKGKDPEVQKRIRGPVRGGRRLTINALRESSDPEIRRGFVSPQTGCSCSKIKRLALFYNRDLDNEADWIFRLDLFDWL